MGGRSSNPNMAYGYQQGQQNKAAIPNVPPLPPQFLQQQQNVQAPRLGQSTSGNGQGGQSQTPAQNNNFPLTIILAKGLPCYFPLETNLDIIIFGKYNYFGEQP